MSWGNSYKNQKEFQMKKYNKRKKSKNGVMQRVIEHAQKPLEVIRTIFMTPEEKEQPVRTEVINTSSLRDNKIVSSDKPVKDKGQTINTSKVRTYKI
jgi:hypothetical protein